VYLAEKFNGEVITTPCVGSSEYLKEQMTKLNSSQKQPTIIATSKKYHFAKPYVDIWNMYQKLLDTGVVFDLLYDCITWIAIGENIEKFIGNESIFVHSGGLRGNETQIKRYERKYK
jgi:1-aminocyclopropane-1-carboxylate deaminase